MHVPSIPRPVSGLLAVAAVVVLSGCAPAAYDSSAWGAWHEKWEQRITAGAHVAASGNTTAPPANGEGSTRGTLMSFDAPLSSAGIDAVCFGNHTVQLEWTLTQTSGIRSGSEDVECGRGIQHVAFGQNLSDVTAIRFAATTTGPQAPWIATLVAG